MIKTFSRIGSAALSRRWRRLLPVLCLLVVFTAPLATLPLFASLPQWQLWIVRLTPSSRQPTALSTPPMMAPGAPTPRSREWLDRFEELAGSACQQLVAGRPRAQRAAARFMTQYRSGFWCHRDVELSREPCERLRHVVAYRARPVGVDERDFPLAFGLRVHTCATQVELLLRAIYTPHNVYCLHVDGSSPPEFVAAMRRMAECLPNVRMAPLDMDFVYKSASQLDADLECMRVALESPVRWRYFFNVAGQELPLKTNRELVAMARTFNGSNHINLHAPSNFNRQAYSHWCRHPDTNRTVLCQEPLRPKPPAPRNVSVLKSSAYGAFSRAFVEYVTSGEGLAGELYAWLRDTIAPEEHYYATLLARNDSSGGGVAAASYDVPVRAVYWRGRDKRSCSAGLFVRDVCILGSADLPRLVRGREPFANKFYFDRDPLAVRCLVQYILRRQAAKASATAVSPDTFFATEVHLDQRVSAVHAPVTRVHADHHDFGSTRGDQN